MRARSRHLLLALVLLALPGSVASAAVPVAETIGSAIAPGVVSGLNGFGEASVVVPAGEKITFLAQTKPPLPGRRIEIWTRSSTSDWRLTTARLAATDGIVHYVATVERWTAFQARFPGDANAAPAVSHGRIANASSDGLTAIGVTCPEFEAAGRAAVARSIVVRSGDLVLFTLCSNPSTGFSWQRPSFNPTYLRQVGHSTHPATNGPPGAPGTETFTFRLVRFGRSTISLDYSQPWAGGLKAAWRFTASVTAARPTGVSCASTYHLDSTIGEPVAGLTDVRVGAHPGYDRIALEFASTGVPQLDLARATPPFLADASGLPVAVEGRAFLQLTMRGASGAETYSGPSRFSPRSTRLVQLVETGDFEGVVGWVAGMTGPACFRVSTLTGPARIVVDLMTLAP